MRRAIATLGALVLVGVFAADVVAEQPRTVSAQRFGQSVGADARQGQQSRACAEITELRAELARLQHELRRLEEALDRAKEAGNRELVRRLLLEIRKVKAEIQDVQHKIRRLQQICRG
jgi:peptidoglycan hydrolase CwlO-like protein